MIKLPIGKVILAPMAGVADTAYREIASDFGATMSFTEMVSAKGLYYNDKKTEALLSVSEKEGVVGAQIFGHEPDVIETVAEKALKFGAAFLDINSGCPAPKVTKNGDGACLMKLPEIFEGVVSAAVKAVSVPVSVKIRMGWDESSLNGVELAKIAEASGASMITVHGRTAKQGYSGTANWDFIKKVVQAVKIPVVGNGDVFSPELAKKMLDETGVSAVMLGRGTFGNPWLIKRTAHFLECGELLPEPTKEEKLDMALKHTKLIMEHKGDYIGIREARKQVLWYIKGMHGAAAVKNLIVKADSYEKMEELLGQLR